MNFTSLLIVALFLARLPAYGDSTTPVLTDAQEPQTATEAAAPTCPAKIQGKTVKDVTSEVAPVPDADPMSRSVVSIGVFIGGSKLPEEIVSSIPAESINRYTAFCTGSVIHRRVSTSMPARPKAASQTT